MEISEIAIFGLLGTAFLFSVLVAMYILKHRQADDSVKTKDLVTISDVLQNQRINFDKVNDKLDHVITVLSKPKQSPKGITLKTQKMLDTARAQLEPKVQAEIGSLILKAIDDMGGQACAKDINPEGISRATKFRKLAKLVEKGYLIKRNNIYHLKTPGLVFPDRETRKEEEQGDDIVAIPW